MSQIEQIETTRRVPCKRCKEYRPPVECVTWQGFYYCKECLPLAQREYRLEDFFQVRLKDLEARVDAIIARMDALPQPEKATSKRFVPPTVEEMHNFFRATDARFTLVTAREWAQKVHDHYQSNGWMVGKVKMKDWKATARNSIRWESCPVNQEPKLDVQERPQDRSRSNGNTNLVGPNYPPKGMAMPREPTDEEREENSRIIAETKRKLKSMTGIDHTKENNAERI